VFDTKIGKIFFIGIGGIGMSGIAEVLVNQGFEVAGSDISENLNIVRLRKLGININIGHTAENINGASIIVISSAIERNNIELIEARKKRIPIVKRAEMLAELMRFKKTIAVAGTHGKTTTTSLMATILENAKYDPTVINGGVINSYNSNAKLGRSDWMVVEADESDGSFLKLPASFVIVTNIDAEHIDFYKSFKELKNAFKRFINNIPFYGAAIICIDDPTIQSIISEIEDKKIITYGLSPQADFRATNIVFKDSKTFFSLEISPKKDASAKKIENMVSNIPGIHNVQNILSVCSMAVELGIDLELIKLALLGFEGVNRRFSLIKNYKGIQIFDDYGHHPIEIKATLSASREISNDKVVAIVQPHRYTRLKLLFEDFTSAFNDADIVFITDIYSAGEKNSFDLTNYTLINALISGGHKDVRAFNDKELKFLIENKLKNGDIVVFLGAGDISSKARIFVEKTLN
tara:strand:+ start:513 stop:1904 length:1392 start_codon:yes stop_codon:yes gene_type:complete